MKAKKIFTILGILVVLADLGWVNYKIFTIKPTVINQTKNCNECPTPEPKIVEETVIPTPTTIVKNITQDKKEKKVSYIPVTGTGQTTENKWTDLSGTDFYLNTGDYNNITEAYFEASLRLFNGNGTAFVRLFDVTAGVEVWGSEVSVSSQNFVTGVSSKMTLKSGNHLYRVQARSLTADTTIFNSGRIKIYGQE